MPERIAEGNAVLPIGASRSCGINAKDPLPSGALRSWPISSELVLLTGISITASIGNADVEQSIIVAAWFCIWIESNISRVMVRIGLLNAEDLSAFSLIYRLLSIVNSPSGQHVVVRAANLLPAIVKNWLCYWTIGNNFPFVFCMNSMNNGVASEVWIQCDAYESLLPSSGDKAISDSLGKVQIQ